MWAKFMLAVHNFYANCQYLEDLGGGPGTKNCFLEGVGRISVNLGRISGNRFSPTLLWNTARRTAVNA